MGFFWVALVCFSTLHFLPHTFTFCPCCYRCFLSSIDLHLSSTLEQCFFLWLELRHPSFWNCAFRVCLLLSSGFLRLSSSSLCSIKFSRPQEFRNGAACTATLCNSLLAFFLFYTGIACPFLVLVPSLSKHNCLIAGYGPSNLR